MALDTRDVDAMTVAQLKDELRKCVAKLFSLRTTSPIHITSLSSIASRYGENVGGSRANLVSRLKPLVAVDRQHSHDLVKDDSFWQYGG